MLYLLWFSGAAAFWVGALLAQINGYPIKILASLGAALSMALGQGAVIWRLRQGRDWFGSLILGFLPAYLGFYLQSQHWVSELFILGIMLSLASLNALLTQRWEQEWKIFSQESNPGPGGAARALTFTLVNILIIIGLLLIWYFPATPLPGRGGAWVLATAAILNQELIKRKYYASYRGSIILAWMSTAFLVGLSFWLLAVLYLRGVG